MKIAGAFSQNHLNPGIKTYLNGTLTSNIVIDTSQVAAEGSTGALRIKMHDKLAALVALGNRLGMFDQRTQKTNVVYAISDEPMSNEEWSKRYFTPH